MPLVLAIMTGFASPTAGQEAVENWRFGGVWFPAQIDTFFVSGADRWPGEPEFGVVLNYVTPMVRSAEFDLYVYPIPEGAGTTSDSVAIAVEYAKSMESVRDYAEQARDGVTLELEEEGLWPTEQSLGQHARYTMRRGSQSRESRLLVFAHDGYFYKFRMTYERSVRRLLDAHLRKFISDALTEVLVAEQGSA